MCFSAESSGQSAGRSSKSVERRSRFGSMEQGVVAGRFERKGGAYSS